jgi:hypothetical protein
MRLDVQRNLSAVASLQHMQNVQCTAKKGNFGSLKDDKFNKFLKKNTLALMDFLFCMPENFTQTTPLLIRLSF